MDSRRLGPELSVACAFILDCVVSATNLEDPHAQAQDRQGPPPEVAKDWISPDIEAGKWEGYTPPPLPQQ